MNSTKIEEDSSDGHITQDSNDTSDDMNADLGEADRSWCTIVIFDILIDLICLVFRFEPFQMC